MKNTRKVALVTGGRRGIGLGIARRLAGENCDIAICDIVEPAEAADAVRELEGLGAAVLYCRADISDATARTKMIAAVKKRFGRLNVLVNNAGVAPKVRADLLDATEESFERVMKINAQGPFFLTQLAAKWMIEQKKADAGFSGCVVNISSVSAAVVSTRRGDYCMSKAALSMASSLWAARLAEFDIPVYEVRPGIIRTDMTEQVKEKYDKLISEGLLLQPRWGEAEDVGKAVAMLVRGDLPYSTGQVLMVDGGLTVARL